jgi:hypothetical protein
MGHQKGCDLRIYRHRCNTSSQLRSTAYELGLEIDVRSNLKDLYLAHDPFQEGETLSDWLQGYRHSGLIINVKEEGLETRVVEIMNKTGITDFFFLDQSFPSLVKFCDSGDSRAAVRVSDLEGLHLAKVMAGRVDWMWFDEFGTGDSKQITQGITEIEDVKVCLVSPELHGRGAEHLVSLQHRLRDLDWQPDAVCTKDPHAWKFF